MTTVKTYRLEDGKYEIDRDEQTGLMVEMRRNGECWENGFESLRFMKVVHAMLNRIDELESPSKDFSIGEKLKPLTSQQMEQGREHVFSTNNPFCPCDSKTFMKVAKWVERHHKIGRDQ